MKDVTTLFGSALDRSGSYLYTSVRSALEADNDIWCLADSDTNEKWAYIGKTDGESLTEYYGILCEAYPVAFLYDTCPCKIKAVLDKCGVEYTAFDEELSCDEAILHHYITDTLIIDDRFLEDDSLPFNQEAFDMIVDGRRYLTPYKFAFDDLIYSCPHYTVSELAGMDITEKDNVIFRKATPGEYVLLEDFLYEAIFIPEGSVSPPREIIKRPELQVYIENFGSRRSDICMFAEKNGKVIGAAWVRIMNDYGSISPHIPSLAISLYPEYRGHGTGTALMRVLLNEVRRNGYGLVSLSVQKANYAYTMYRKLGFETVRETADEYIMKKYLF